MNLVLIYAGKLISISNKKLNLGSGSTWPGHIALGANKNFIKQLLKKNNIKIILVAGTNGKTTTSSMIQAILKADGKKVIHNETGANLLNGIASTLILKANALGKIQADYAIFEIDENALPLVLEELTPDYLLLLNLFRDQLDRYGEVHSIAERWEQELKKLPQETTIILNADDSEIANLGNKTTATPFYFGLKNNKNANKEEHAADSIYCPNCGAKLSYTSRTFSHLGEWQCKKCGLRRPKVTFEEAPTYPLSGTYNMYNTIAAVALARRIGIREDIITSALKSFEPAFGRQEIIKYNEKKIQILLSKNPTGLNESLRTLKTLGAKHILFILNDRIPDGLDVSWIWDVDFEALLTKNQHIYSSGDRAADMTLRLKYAHPTVTHVDTFSELEKGAIDEALKNVSKNETLYILPTYSAMLDVRKILTGKKIL
jgi:UDP-N-acetylmuramyl tripeptide synthase